MQQQIVADPVSRSQLRKYALDIRRMVGFEDKLYFPVDRFLESFVCNPDFYGYDLEIRDIHEMPKNLGETDPSSKIIRIRKDVYERACCNVGRDRFTVAHEVSHALLHCGALKLSRVDDFVEVEPFRKPEWHANALAGELLIPHHLIQYMSIEEIKERCCVSYTAASVQKNCK